MAVILSGRPVPYFFFSLASWTWTASAGGSGVESDIFLLPKSADRGGQDHRIEGLGDDADRSDVLVPGDLVGLHLGRHEDDGEPRRGGERAQRLEGRGTVHARH